MTMLLYFFTGAGILLAALAIPLILKKVKPNPIYGFRVSQTLNDPDVWYEVNQTCGKCLLISGCSIVAAAVLFVRIPGISIDTYALACLAVFLVTLIPGLYFCWRILPRKES